MFIINNDLSCDYLVLASGSKSYKDLGSDESSYELAKSLGHSITNLYPSLVPIVVKEKDIKKLSGVRSFVSVSIFLNDKLIKTENGELQFTDYGLSGICIFNLSRYVSLLKKGKMYIKINFMPFLKEDIFDYLNKDIEIYNLLCRFLNEKVARYLLDSINIKYNDKINNLNDYEKEKLEESLLNMTFTIEKTKSFDVSQVTAGGVRINEINIDTFESKKVSNLYLLGELLDVDGDCGGYNISFAILSSLLAANSIGEKND